MQTWLKAKDIISIITKKYDLSSDNFVLFNIWEKELGKLSKNIVLVGKKNKTLLVKINNPIYKQELILRKKEFINKINQYFGKNEFVNEIKIWR